MQRTALAAPFLVAGLVKIAYDLVIYVPPRGKHVRKARFVTGEILHVDGGQSAGH